MKLSVQLYTVRTACESDLPGTLAALTGMGLNYVELAGSYGLSAAEWRSLLDSLGLRASATHVPIEVARDDTSRVVDDARTIGVRHVVVPWLDKDWYANGWAACAKAIEPIARPIREAGLRFSYHNHSFELALENGVPGLRRFFDAADPNLIDAQIDTYWVFHGGQDPGAFIRMLVGRVPTVHLKDGVAGSEPRDAEPLDGALDWDGILLACGESGVEFGAIEYDHAPRDPLVSVRASVDFFRSKGIAE